MNIRHAWSKGVDFGGIVGIALAGLGLLVGFGPESSTLVFKIAKPGFLAIIPEIVAGTLGGALAFGSLFAVSHAVVHSVPGLRTLMGEPKSPGQPAPHSFAAEVGRGKSVAERIEPKDIRLASSQQVPTPTGTREETNRQTRHVENLHNQREFIEAQMDQINR